jgi:hypothetical protein
LNDRVQFLVDLHLQVCDLDYAQLPENVMALNSNFLSLFSTARQQTLASLVVQVEARIARLRSSIAVQSVPLATPTLSPPSSQSVIIWILFRKVIYSRLKNQVQSAFHKKGLLLIIWILFRKVIYSRLKNQDYY